MNFVAIDVETANADLASICQIGITTRQALAAWAENYVSSPDRPMD